MTQRVSIGLNSYEQESKFTKEEALCWAERYYEVKNKWPLRRFRLDGTPAGNSKLLTKKSAEQTQIKYGGRIVEMVPEKEYYIDMCRIESKPCVIAPPPKKGRRR